MFNILSQKKQSVGLDIGSSSLKAVELRSTRKGCFELVGMGFEELSPDYIVDGAILDKNSVADAINRIFAHEHIKNNRVATSISGHSVIVKKISVVAQQEADLAEAIHWEAEQYIPFDIADVNIDYQILGEDDIDGKWNVLLVAVKKEKIQDYTQVLTLAGKVPALVDVDAFALQNAYEFNYEPAGNTTAALLDIGSTTMTINIVSGTEFLFTRDVSVGGHNYTEFLQKEFNLNYDTAQHLKHGEKVGTISDDDAAHVIDSVTEIICMEIQKTFDFFKHNSTVENIDRMLVSGGAAHTPGLIDALGRKFEIPVEIFNSFRKITADPRQFSTPMLEDQAPDMAIAVGLALRSAEA
ncbi:MAG: pilus assembly protein PilM [Acidobacteriota bacterium]|nr:pilus assembly protein PilM [Acidobacteriota bacterium]